MVGCTGALWSVLARVVARCPGTDRNPSKPFIDDICQFDTLQPYLLNHGRHSLAWSTTQDGIRHFLLPDVGFVAYAPTKQPAWSKVIVLGDPVAHPSSWRELLLAFIKRHKRATFMHISHAFGVVISEALGYDVNSMGGETQLTVAAYNFVGANGRPIRLDAARAQRAGVVVEEVPRVSEHMALPADLAAQLRLVSAEWEANKGTSAGKAWFLLRPPKFEDEAPGTRIFIAWAPGTSGMAEPDCKATYTHDDVPSSVAAAAYLPGSPASSLDLAANVKPHAADDFDNGQVVNGLGGKRLLGSVANCTSRSNSGLSKPVSGGSDTTCSEAGSSSGRHVVGFVVLDPMYEGGRLVGYLRNIVRTSSHAHNSTVSLMTKAVLDTLRREEQQQQQRDEPQLQQKPQQKHQPTAAAPHPPHPKPSPPPVRTGPSPAAIAKAARRAQKRAAAAAAAAAAAEQAVAGGKVNGDPGSSGEANGEAHLASPVLPLVPACAHAVGADGPPRSPHHTACHGKPQIPVAAVCESQCELSPRVTAGMVYSHVASGPAQPCPAAGAVCTHVAVSAVPSSPHVAVSAVPSSPHVCISAVSSLHEATSAVPSSIHMATTAVSSPHQATTGLSSSHGPFTAADNPSSSHMPGGPAHTHVPAHVTVGTAAPPSDTACDGLASPHAAVASLPGILASPHAVLGSLPGIPASHNAVIEGKASWHSMASVSVSAVVGSDDRTGANGPGGQPADPAGRGLVLSLGLSPAYCMKEDPAFHHNILVRWLLDWGWKHGQAFYPFQGVAASKVRYGGGAAALEATGQYSDPAARWLPCWEASGAGPLALLEHYQLGITTGVITSWLHNARVVLQQFSTPRSRRQARKQRGAAHA